MGTDMFFCGLPNTSTRHRPFLDAALLILKLLLIGYGNAAAQLHGAARVLGRWRAALWAKGARCAIVKKKKKRKKKKS